MATPIKDPIRSETPIFFEVLAAKETTFEAFREDTKALDLQSWKEAKEVADQ